MKIFKKFKIPEFNFFIFSKWFLFYIKWHCVKSVNYGVISGPYFPIQSKYRKTWTRNNSVFGRFSRSMNYRLFKFDVL